MADYVVEIEAEALTGFREPLEDGKAIERQLLSFQPVEIRLAVDSGRLGATLTVRDYGDVGAAMDRAWEAFWRAAVKAGVPVSFRSATIFTASEYDRIYAAEDAATE